MKIFCTKFFRFSASFSEGSEIHGHNYVLGVTMPAMDRPAERRIDEKIEAALIRRIDSRDLGMDVDFLKGVPMTDSGLLKAFWQVISREITPITLEALSLERDKRTVTKLLGEN